MARVRQGIIQIASSSAAGQAALLIATPVLTRLYSPDQLGTLTMIVAVAGVLGAVAALRLEGAIALTPKPYEAHALARLCLVMGLVSALIVAMTVGLLRGVGLVDLPGVWLWALPALVLQGSWFASLSQLSFRVHNYGAVASRTLVQTISGVGGQVVGGFLYSATATLIGVQIAARFLGIASLSRLEAGWLAVPSRGKYRELVSRYRRFPSVFAPSALLNALTLAVPVLYLGVHFGASVAGQVGIAQRVVIAPLSLVGTAVAQVFLAEIASRVRNGDLDNRAIYLRATGYLVLAGLLFSSSLAILGGYLISPVLGEGWQLAGEMVVVMSLPAFFQFAVSPLSGVFVAYEAALANISLDVVRAGLLFGSATAVFLLGLGPLSATALLFGSVGLVYLLTWFVGLRLVSAARRPPASVRT